MHTLVHAQLFSLTRAMADTIWLLWQFNAWLLCKATLVDFKVLDKLTKSYMVKNDYKD